MNGAVLRFFQEPHGSRVAVANLNHVPGRQTERGEVSGTESLRAQWTGTLRASPVRVVKEELADANSLVLKLVRDVVHAQGLEFPLDPRDVLGLEGKVVRLGPYLARPLGRLSLQQVQADVIVEEPATVASLLQGSRPDELGEAK